VVRDSRYTVRTVAHQLRGAHRDEALRKVMAKPVRIAFGTEAL